MKQLALSNYHYVYYSFEFFLRSMREFNCKKIELYAASPHLSIQDADNSQIKRIAENLRSEGINVCCLTQEQCLYPINIASEDFNIRARSIRSFIRCLEIADMIGSPKILVTPGRGCLDFSREEAWKRSADALHILSEKAARYGITLLLEGVSHMSTNLVTTADEAIAMLNEVSQPNLQSMLDICVLFRENQDLVSSINTLGPFLKHIHLSDYHQGNRYALGDGALPLTEFIQALCAAGYTDDIALEVMNHIYDSNPHDCTERCVSYWNRILSRRV